jgi:hypothetical protein
MGEPEPGASPQARRQPPAWARNTGCHGHTAAAPLAGSAAVYGHGRSSLCTQQLGLAERTGQKIILKHEVSDLRVQRFQIHGGRGLAARRRTVEQAGGTLRQLRLPTRDLVRVDIINLRQLSRKRCVLIPL